MTEVAIEPNKAAYLDAWEKLPAGAPEWLRAIRERGAERFAETALPNSRQEAWRFTNIAPITGGAFAPLAEPGTLNADAVAPHLYPGLPHTAVFVDGVFAPALSSLASLPKNVEVANLAASGAAFVQDHLDSLADAVPHAFTALNAAFLVDGCCVRFGKNAVCEEPIHIVFIASGAANAAVQPRVLVVAEEGAQGAVIESYGAAGAGPYFTNAVSEYILGANAHIRGYKMIREGAAGYHLATQRVRQDRDSSYTSYVFNLGGAIVRNEIALSLDGEGAGCSLHGLYLGEAHQLIDNHQSIIHAKPHCTSWIGYKGVLDGDSKAVYTGKIYVDRAAQKTDSNQLNQNLLLSDDAQIDTKPQLEIYADDVKCTHGATIGQFPPELINYFRSRGIAPDMAKAMLTYGFADEVVREVEVEPLREFLESYVFDRYSP